MNFRSGSPACQESLPTFIGPARRHPEREFAAPGLRFAGARRGQLSGRPHAEAGDPSFERPRRVRNDAGSRGIAVALSREWRERGVASHLEPASPARLASPPAASTRTLRSRETGAFSFLARERREERAREWRAFDRRLVEAVVPSQPVAVGEQDDGELAIRRLEIERGVGAFPQPGMPEQRLAAPREGRRVIGFVTEAMLNGVSGVTGSPRSKFA